METNSFHSKATDPSFWRVHVRFGSHEAAVPAMAEDISSRDFDFFWRSFHVSLVSFCRASTRTWVGFGRLKVKLSKIWEPNPSKQLPSMKELEFHLVAHLCGWGQLQRSRGSMVQWNPATKRWDAAATRCRFSRRWPQTCATKTVFVDVFFLSVCLQIWTWWSLIDCLLACLLDWLIDWLINRWLIFAVTSTWLMHTDANIKKILPQPPSTPTDIWIYFFSSCSMIQHFWTTVSNFGSNCQTIKQKTINLIERYSTHRIRGWYIYHYLPTFAIKIN